jgi:hypothetical protein
MPRFVILEHDHPHLHWDLMLEVDGALRTWRLPAPPCDGPREATALGDHRLAYLDYEGPVSGNRGTVKRWDAGTYLTERRDAAGWVAVLRGGRWSGTVALAPRDGDRWDATCTPIV